MIGGPLLQCLLVIADGWWLGSSTATHTSRGSILIIAHVPLLCGLCLALHIFSGTLSLVGVFCSCGNPIEAALQFYIISGKHSKSVIRNRFLSYVSPWGFLSHSASIQPTNLCKVQDSFNFSGDFSGDKLKRPFHFLELMRVLFSSPCHSFAVRQHMSVFQATQFVVLCSPSKLIRYH